MGEIKPLITPNHTNQPSNAVLFQMYQDLNDLVPILKHLLRPKIKQFMQDNGGRIESIMSEIRKLQNEYFVIVNNNIQMQEPLLNADGTPANLNAQPTPKLQQGKSITEFGERYQKLMQLPTTIV